MKRIFLLLAFVSVFLILSMSIIPSAQSSMVKEEIEEKYRFNEELIELYRNFNDRENNIFVNQFLSILYILIVFFKAFTIYDSHDGEWGFILCLLLSIFVDFYGIFLLIISIFTFNFYLMLEIITVWILAIEMGIELFFDYIIDMLSPDIERNLKGLIE